MIFLSLVSSQDQGSPAFSRNRSSLVVSLEELYRSHRGQSLPQWLSGKESVCSEDDAGSIPGLGRSPGEGTTRPSILAWKIPRTEEPNGLQSVGLQKVRQDSAYMHTCMQGSKVL